MWHVPNTRSKGRKKLKWNTDWSVHDKPVNIDKVRGVGDCGRWDDRDNRVPLNEREGIQTILYHYAVSGADTLSGRAVNVILIKVSFKPLHVLESFLHHPQAVARE